MPQTGKSFQAIGPNRIKSGLPGLEHILESANQTYTLGAPVVISAGYLKEMATDGTAIRGFAARAGQNGATDGAKEAQFTPAEGNEFAVTLSAVLAQTALGAPVALQKASSSWYAVTEATASNSYVGHINGWGSDWAIGDTAPVVFISIDPVNIQFNT